MHNLNQIITKMIFVWKLRFPWLWERAREDFKQVIALACVEDFRNPNANVGRNLEKLARELGWRKIKEENRRKWVDDYNWLKRGRKRVGAPIGNQNAKVK